MQNLLETYDNPVNLSEWFNTKPSFHLRGGQRFSHFQPTRLEMVSDNQLTTSTGKAFTYDDNGNLTLLHPDTGTNTSLAYDYDNQLTQYTQGTTSLAYQYDALGNRIKKTQGSTITKYIVDPNRGLPSVLCETNASGAIIAYYVYGLGLISKVIGNNAYYYQYDGIGSTVAITDSNGIIKNKYAYDDFGNLASNSTETITNSFKYVGKYGVATDLNDLLYMRARYYIPSIGRFTQYDPIGAINPYIYTDNNPINYIDPDGNIVLVLTVPTILLILAAGYVITTTNWQAVGDATGDTVNAAADYIGETTQRGICYFKEHTKNKSKSKWNKHTKPHSSKKPSKAKLKGLKDGTWQQR
jgi:RHS repeat-associated protein